MWKDWLERTLTGNKVPVMLASEIMCAEPANGNEYGPTAPATASRAATRPLDDQAHSEPAEVE